MKLRITSGLMRGRYIEYSARCGSFRPTAERIRQGCINVLRPYIAGAIAADVCAGSGAVGFEMLSEGARAVHFVESDWQQSAAIRKQCKLLGVCDRSLVIERDVATFMKQASSHYDIIFYDPPYEDEELASFVQPLCSLLAPGGILIYERSKRRKSPALNATDLWNVTERTYGETTLEFWTRATN